MRPERPRSGLQATMKGQWNKGLGEQKHEIMKNYDADFMINLLKSNLFKKELNKLVEGSGLKIIKSTYLKEVKLPLPDFDKQQKTGELLKLIERKIILNRKTIELEKQAKEAILNKTIGGN